MKDLLKLTFSVNFPWMSTYLLNVIIPEIFIKLSLYSWRVWGILCLCYQVDSKRWWKNDMQDSNQWCNCSMSAAYPLHHHGIPPHFLKAIHGWHFFSNSNSIYLHLAFAPYVVVFIVNGAVRLSCVDSKQNTTHKGFTGNNACEYSTVTVYFSV